MTLPTAPIVNDLNPERMRGIFFGAPGAGKTTLAAGWFPQTNLIIDLEGGTRFLGGKHFVERPKSYSEFMVLVNDLANGGHPFRTVTIDTGDHLVRMADSEAGQRGGKVAAGLIEYGKGMADRDGTILRDIGRLLSTDLGVILCAHSTTVDVGGEDGKEATSRLFPRIDRASDDRLRQPIIGLFDFMLLVRKHADETRDLVTGGHAAYETKRRVPLPNVMPADAGELFKAVKAGIAEVTGAPAAHERHRPLAA